MPSCNPLFTELASAAEEPKPLPYLETDYASHLAQ